jgi:hypothetical protein
MPSNEYMRRYMLARYRATRKYFIDKLGGCCVICGVMEGLQFDHINPNTKVFTISGRSWSRSKEDLSKEVEKCQLLCSACHYDKTIKDKHQNSAKSTHGTLSSYRYCKCDLCVSAKREYNRAYKKRRGS